MIFITGIIIASVFLTLSLLHFYWAFGGRWGGDQAIPKDVHGKKVLNPKKIDCVIVGVTLGLSSFYYVIKAGIVAVDLPSWMLNYGYWVISTVFFLRAIGDFKYVGFTKRIRGTDFALLDTKYFSPLCLMLALSCLLFWIGENESLLQCETL